jgi:hypothetical protein
MNMNAVPVSRRRCPAKFRSHDHGVFEKVAGRTVTGRNVEDNSEAPLGLVKPAGNQILHGNLMQIPNHECGSINIAFLTQQLIELQGL